MQKYYDALIKEIISKKLDKEKIAKRKLKLCKKHGMKKPPTDIEILLHAKDSQLSKLKVLQTKPTRSLSGVAVVAIMTKPHQCPHVKKGVGPCIMCPGGPKSSFGDVPQSYTGKEPATLRAIRNKYEAYLQIFNRLEQYIVLGHVPDKVELILMGGTFPSTSKKYKEGFVTDCFNAMNDFSKLFFSKGKLDVKKFKEFFELPGEVGSEERTKSIQKKVMELKRKNKKGLESAQSANEKAKIKCVGLTIETRSDYATLKYANEMLRFGCTRVEIGVQSVYDKVLKKINRGHGTKETIKSFKILKDLGFKINAHYMPGLFVDYDEDLLGMIMLFEDPDYRPDMLKLYPCMVMKGTKLYDLWKKKKYKPLTTKKAAKLIAEFKQFVPEYCRIMRVQRDIPTYATTAGVDRTNLRQYIQKEMEKNDVSCRCIRCREIGRSDVKINVKKIELLEDVYEASDGIEFFFSLEFEDKVIGFCRLRFPSQSLRKEIKTDSALIRELHVYGEAVSVGGKGKVQHKGFGKMLLDRAEEVAKTYYKKKMIVISGVGVRGYYRKFGYKKEGPYMVKKLS